MSPSILSILVLQVTKGMNFFVFLSGENGMWGKITLFSHFIKLAWPEISLLMYCVLNKLSQTHIFWYSTNSVTSFGSFPFCLFQPQWFSCYQFNFYQSYQLSMIIQSNTRLVTKIADLSHSISWSQNMTTFKSPNNNLILQILFINFLLWKVRIKLSSLSLSVCTQSNSPSSQNN